MDLRGLDAMPIDLRGLDAMPSDLRGLDAMLMDLRSPKQAAKLLHVEVETLAKWRTTRRYGLKYVKIGGRVAYRLSDIHAFLASRTVEGTEAPPSNLKAQPFTPKNPRPPKPAARRRRAVTR